MPFSVESNVKAIPTGEVHYQKIEANVPIDEMRFHMPAAAASAQPGTKPADAAETLPKKPTKRNRPQSRY